MPSHLVDARLTGTSAWRAKEIHLRANEVHHRATRRAHRALSVTVPNVRFMRFLHTSDWHIGRTFHGHDLLADQRAVLGALAAAAGEHDVDAVLVSGDIYDRAVPSADAMQVAADAVTAIRRTGAEIVAISGNHDSGPRLGVFSDVLAHGGLHLFTTVDRTGEPVIFEDGDGPVAVYPIPYLEPDIARTALAVDGSVGHREMLAAAMARVHNDLAGRPAGTRSVVMAHAFVGGGVGAGSERPITVGGVESVPAGVFEGIDYVALGHLHGRQTLDQRMRYPGSPLPYSFTEAGHRKGAWLIDLDSAGTVTASWLDLPVVRPLATIRGGLDEILESRTDLAEHYLAVELTDPVRPTDPMRRLRARFPFALTVTWMPPGEQLGVSTRPVPSAAMPDEAIITAFLEECRGSGPSDIELSWIAQALDHVRSAEVVG
jgi:exonuclease SbcD